MQQVLIFQCVKNDDWPIQDDTTIFRISFPATLEGNKGKIVSKDRAHSPISEQTRFRLLLRMINF